MNEPVAYINITKNGTSNLSTSVDAMADEVVPLYTAEQLHQRVKMTQAEFDEFKNLISEYGFVLDALQAIYNGKYKNLNSKLFNGRTVESDNEQVKILTNLMSKFDPDNPEETIEIVPEMKWFVRRILPNAGGNMLYCTDEGELTYNHNKEYATKFDTKEEADRWVNPLTEAVHLPVEGE